LAEALQELDDEDPALAFEWVSETRSCQVKVLGKVQLEILADLLQSRYGLHPEFGPANVLYRETPEKSGEGFVSYTMPKPCWAILRFEISPAERGSGLTYRSQAHPDRLLPRYQKEVERRVPDALQQGLRGWPVTDVNVVLIDGEHHVWHTHPLDFVVATPMAIMDGLTRTGTKLLEPILAFRISAPEEVGGRIMSDLITMRATFESPWTNSGHFTLEGEIPLATSMDYAVELSRLTGGRGSWTSRFHEYREAPPGAGQDRARRGVDPRDRARYILSVRDAPTM
jgi:ribosomal protection tetracycline resistance protein